MYHYTSEYRGAAHNVKYSVPKETLIVIKNGSNDDYHFIQKELAEEPEGQITRLGENSEKPSLFQ